MYSILPFIFILISLAVMIFVIVRKFPQLTLLDVESIPEVRVGRKKDEFLKKKAKKNAEDLQRRHLASIQPFINKLKQLQSWFRNTVLKVYKKTEEKAGRMLSQKKHTQTFLSSVNEKNIQSTNVKKLVAEGSQALQDSNWEIAEEKFINAIRLDTKNIDAYLGLGVVYMKKEEWREAIDTFEFLLKINPENVRALLSLAEIFENRKDLEKAIEYYERAVMADNNKAETFIKLADLLLDINQCEGALEAASQASELEPENQVYLDKVVDISVKCGNKEIAEEYYQKLRMLDPNNNRLVVLRGKIDQV